MSLLGDPSVIFLDEPTTGLDPQSRLSMWNMIRALAGSGTTIFLTTQYLEEAEQLADDIAILHNGTIAAEGTPEELKGLSQGMLELSFYDCDGMQKAFHLLEKFQPRQNIERMVLNIPTDGSVTQMAGILNLLNKENLPLSGFAQKPPTLEDAFLKLVENGGAY